MDGRLSVWTGRMVAAWMDGGCMDGRFSVWMNDWEVGG